VNGFFFFRAHSSIRFRSPVTVVPGYISRISSNQAGSCLSALGEEREEEKEERGEADVKTVVFERVEDVNVKHSCLLGFRTA
jgi:hypothetical protein